MKRVERLKLLKRGKVNILEPRLLVGYNGVPGRGTRPTGSGPNCCKGKYQKLVTSSVTR